MAKPVIILAVKYGQLGNRLFHFSHLIAAALEHGAVVYNPAFADYSEYFVGTRERPSCWFPPAARGPSADRIAYFLLHYLTRVAAPLVRRVRRAPIVCLRDGERANLEDADFAIALNRWRVVLLQGWEFRHDSGVVKHASVIRSFFTPIPSVQAPGRARVQRLRDLCDLVVGVHIRQGDIRAWKGPSLDEPPGRYYYETSDYVRLMREVVELFSPRRVGFLICSNVPQDRNAFQGLIHDADGGTAIEDLCAFAETDSLMGPPSTFTMWASFQGEVPLWRIRGLDQRPEPHLFYVDQINDQAPGNTQQA